MRICVSILGKSNAEALRKMNRPYNVKGEHELILELRFDWIRDPDPERLLSRKFWKILATNRRKEEGGRFSGKEEERVATLIQAAAHGADYVDIEAGTAPRLIKALKGEIARAGEKRTKLVISWHDFQKTPSERVLRGMLSRCSKWQPDVVKIVTMAHTAEDNLNILRLIPYARAKGLEIIAFCMGQAGKVSRVASPLLGGYLTFAAANHHEASAPGQMPVREMTRILNDLNHTDKGPIPKCGESE